jgi:ABC-type multidrug transport system fused ATPase/permease subunit
VAYCTKCGFVLRDGANFCSQCSAPVSKAVKKGRHSKQSLAHEQQIDKRSQKQSKKQPKAVKWSGKKLNKRAFIFRVAAKAMAKSLALSAAILGPGFVLLTNDFVVIGMIWLFVGSFSMMAWTYRKPWRLNILTSLLPSLAAIVSCAVQLTLFHDSIPPVESFILAIGTGLVIGRCQPWRANAKADSPR